MTNEEIISEFLRAAYSDERLATLLAHAEDGRLSFYSCCCLIGIPTATHALETRLSRGVEKFDLHYSKAKYGKGYTPPLRNARAVELAFKNLSENGDDAERRAKLIPLVLIEIQRRDETALAESAEQVFQEVKV